MREDFDFDAALAAPQDELGLIGKDGIPLADEGTIIAPLLIISLPSNNLTVSAWSFSSFGALTFV